MSDRIVIPEALRPEILSRIHEGHPGATKGKLRAKSCIFWPTLNEEIETMTLSCNTCLENRGNQCKQPLNPHEIPSRPWQVLGTDLFHWNGSEYLVLVDYYTKYPFVRQIIGHATSEAISDLTKQILSEHGIPDKIISDNGPQYTGASYRKMIKNWNIEHVTSSPGFPQSNGMAERTVQTIKQVLHKTFRSGGDLHMALMCLRATPIDDHLPSPAELLMGRKIQTCLPTRIRSAPDHSAVKQRLQERQSIQKNQFDVHSKELAPLVTGQKIWLQESAGKWIPARVVLKCPEPRSYLVETLNGRKYRRNRVHLLDAPHSYEFPESPVNPETCNFVPIAPNPFVQPLRSANTSVVPMVSPSVSVLPVKQSCGSDTLKNTKEKAVCDGNAKPIDLNVAKKSVESKTANPASPVKNSFGRAIRKPKRFDT